MNDSLSSSLGNLQSEVEGTKTNVKQLEKRINTIGNELSNIDGNIKLVVQLLTPNPSLHSESPPSTPYSPYTKPTFSFGSPTSEDIGIESMDNNSLTLGVPSPSYKRNSGDRFRSSPLIETKQIINNVLANSIVCKNVDNQTAANETVDKFLKLDLKNNYSSKQATEFQSPRSPSSVACISRNSKALIDMGSPKSPMTRNNLFTHAFNTQDTSRHAIVVAADRKRENGYVGKTTDL